MRSEASQLTIDTISDLVRFAHSDVQRVSIGGLKIARLDRLETARHIIGTALSRRGSNSRPAFYTTANGQVISYCATNPEILRLYESAEIINADGMSVVYASKLRKRLPLPERVATTDVFHDIAKLAQETGVTFYMLGGKDDVLLTAIERVRQMYPNLKIVGSRSGYFRDTDWVAIAEEINAAQPDVLWVGLGVPKQQKFVVQMRDQLTNVGAVKTCGGLFDFLSGAVPRAPRWMQATSLEWLYRTLKEPRRLGPRYLITNPHALYLILTR